MNISKAVFGKRLTSRAVILAEVAALCLASSVANAAIIDSGVVNLTVPASTVGIYINVVTNVNSTAAAVAGWDFNPWASGGNLQFFSSTNAANNNQVVGAANAITALAPGATIGPASTFGATGGAGGNTTGTAFRLTGTTYAGFRFTRESDTSLHYGYAEMTTTAGTGFPAVVVRYVYEDVANTAITIPAGVSAPIFGYTPAAASTVSFTGGTTIGSTGNASIAVAVATPGSGTGAPSTTTTTCTAPTGNFAGFAQTVTAEGTGAISGGPLTGTCTLTNVVQTQPLTCSENRGGTPTAVTFTLSCPAGTASADLSITKTNGATVVAQGGTTTYTIVASNAGPQAATGATVADTFPASCASVAWTCTGAGGGTCTASGAGNINDTVNLPSGGSVTYSAICTIGAAATGTLSNTATVTAPGGVTDPTPGNNSATDGPDNILTDVPPVFAYTPPPGAVTFTGGTTVGSTGSASIAVTIGTAGLGTGANATTTTTCTVPGGFTGFGQSVTAVGPAATTTGGPLTGTCLLGAAAVNAAMTCNEVQGVTTVPRVFNLTCPAGTAVPLTSTPISGSTVTLPQQTLGGAAINSVITFQNPGLAAATVTCTAPAAPEFTVAPLTITVPASGNAPTTVTFSSAVIGSFTGVLNCTAGAQAFTFNLAGSTGVPATAIPALGDGMRQLLMLAMLAMGLIAVGVYSRRS
jgi:uncharacterized repeat protein (TIGR01451 family)